SEAAGRELHRVDRLQTLRAARGADQPYDLVVQVRRIATAERMEPVESILERPRDRALVHRAAPEHPVRGVAGLDQLLGVRRRSQLELWVVQRQVELPQVEESRLGAGVGRPGERDGQSREAARGLGERAA